MGESHISTYFAGKNFPGASTHLGHNDTFVFYSEISFFLLNISTRFSRLSLNIFFSEYQKINFHWVKIILIFVTLKTLKNLKKYKIGDRIWLASATRVSRLAPAPISQVSLRPGQTVHDCWWLFCVGNYHQQSCTIMLCWIRFSIFSKVPYGSDLSDFL